MGINIGNRWGPYAWLAALVACWAAASPAQAATGTGEGRAVIIRPATLVNTGPLSFGNLISGPTPGTATVSPAGARSTTGGVTPVGGTVSAAAFTAMNDSGGWLNLLRIIRPTSPITLTRVGGGATMTVDNFTLSVGNGLFGSGWYFVPSNTVFTFTVGGRLSVAANQMPGTYTGTFEITVDYN